MAMDVAVVGAGQLGVTQAAGLAELGHQVTARDVDPQRVDLLTAGTVPFHEPGLEPMVGRHLASGRLRFTTSVEAAVGGAAVVLLCVGTPQRRDGDAADLTQLYAAVEAVARCLSDGALVVGRSTVPVGTAEQLAGRLTKLAPAGLRAELAWSPEFLREGHALDDTLRPDRLVFGVQSPAAEQTLRALFAGPVDAGAVVVSCDLPTAELVKVAANSFLATKISFINAMAELCERTGADVVTLADAIGHDPRIGRRFLDAGLGFGGGCLPKDIRAFMARAAELGAEQTLSFLREVDAINMRRRHRMVDLAREECGGRLLGRRIGVLGAAFKPDSDDVRDSPALNVAAQLQLQGAHVTVYDPCANARAAELFPTLGYAPSAEAAAEGAHLLMHLTEWPEFIALDPERLGPIVCCKRVLDGRNKLPADRWLAAGWTYRALGRPAQHLHAP